VHSRLNVVCRKGRFADIARSTGVNVQQFPTLVFLVNKGNIGN
jgi:hypothetical protein